MSNRPSNGSAYSPGITRISVTGFKSLANRTDVEIRPLTILAGANSSGKSSLMQPLLLMKQTLESAVTPAGPFLLAGPYIRFTETHQFLSGSGSEIIPGQQLDLEIEMQLGRRMIAGLTFAVDQNGQFDVVETRGLQGDGQLSVKLQRGDSSAKLKSAIAPWKDAFEQLSLAELSVDRYKYYLGVRAVHSPRPASSKQVYELIEILSLNSQIRDIIHIPGLRGDQQRKWLLANVPAAHPFATNTFEGPFESYVASLIDSWQQPTGAEKLIQLDESLKRLGLADGVRAERLNESEVEVWIPRTANSADDDCVNIADVGLALSTVLPVLVALVQADLGQLVYVEQPELHLHPRAQWRLAQLLAEAANRGVCLVIETHSSLLLRGILTEIAREKIPNDKVILHWFERDKETGISTVISKGPDSVGRVGDWPEDFSDVELGSDNDYLNAVEGKLFAAKK